MSGTAAVYGPGWRLICYARSYRFAAIAQRAFDAGLGKDIASDIGLGWCSEERLTELLTRHPEKANLITSIHEDVKAENKRNKDMQVARSREWRTRQREKRVDSDNRTCPVCGASMTGKRADATVCSDVCRVRHHRSRASGLRSDASLFRNKT